MVTSQKLKTANVEFSSVQSKTGEFFVAKQEANYADSMKILKEYGYQALTYQEALARAPELIKELMGKWFWLAGDGKDLTKGRGVYTFDEHGELTKLKGGEKPDQQVRVYSGEHPLSLGVDSGLYDDGRFSIFADDGPDVVAPVVVGVKVEQELLKELNELKSAQRKNTELADKLEKEAQQLRQKAAAQSREIEKREKLAELLRN